MDRTDQYPTPGNSSNYIPGIDGLRALAVLAVVIFHMEAAWIPGGFIGVDIFFVISGYVVSASLARTQYTRLLPFTLGFYKRRILRIYPALIVCLLVVAVFKSLFIPTSWLSKTTELTGVFAFFGLSNFALILLNDGYFAPRAEFNVFTHTWSLAVEEQFYLIFPLLLFFWLVWRTRKNWTRFVPVVFIGFSVVVSFALAAYLTTAKPDQAFYLLPSRFWELASGALLFILHHKSSHFLDKNWVNEFFIVLGLIIMTGAFWLVDANAFPFPWAVLPVLGAVFCIHGLVTNQPQRIGSRWLLENPLMVYIGKISYSLYLWHWSVFVLFRWTIGMQTTMQYILAVGIAVVLSILSYHFVEQPVRRYKGVKKHSDRQMVLAGVAVIIVSALAAKSLFDMQSKISLSVTKDHYAWHPLQSNILQDKVDSTIEENWSGRQLFIMGDSHAGAYSYMQAKLKRDYGVQVHQFIHPGCSVVGLVRPMNKVCLDYIQQSLAKIKTLSKPGDVVFLASLRMVRLGDQWKSFSEAHINDRLNSKFAGKLLTLAIDEAKPILQTLSDLSLDIIMDAPKPVFKSPPFRCSDWFNKNNPICQGGLTMPREEMQNYRQNVLNSTRILQEQFPKLIVWDNFEILCPGDPCSAFKGEQPLFFDGDHLSGYANTLLYPSFVSLLKSLWEPEPQSKTAG